MSLTGVLAPLSLSPTTLVVVDMQRTFDSSLNPTAIVNVAKEIERAVKRNSGIVLVEYKDCDPTHNVFRELLQGYKHVATTRKNENDGSLQVIRTIRRRTFGQKKLRVVGVNSCHCVYGTVIGLLRWPGIKVEVAKKGCACSCSNQKCWDKFPACHSRLSFVE